MKPAKRVRKWVLGRCCVVSLAAVLFSVFVNRYLEPVLRDRLHTLIIQGSDSLYRYQLGKLNANFFGGSVEVRNLHIQIDSSRYQQLAAAHALPPLTMELDLVRGQINGTGCIWHCCFTKRSISEEIVSTDARHPAAAACAQ